MTAQPNQSQFALQRFLSTQEDMSPLRIVVCGSVDHGKSTLIGRLLYEADNVFEDQLDTLKHLSRRHGSENGDIDFSLLLDGLAAEREQKITIDVAYRFFATNQRKFIIADAPGHEQYTRNMATGASTADVALILVNVASGLTAQTRRHSLIVSMLGVRQFVVAVNKMDLVDWSEAAFRAIENDFHQLAGELDINQVVCIPVSARDGENIVSSSAAMPWYRGPSVLAQLEQMDVVRAGNTSGFRMPVQWVNRPNADFRGYSGLITSGTVQAGMDARILPSGETTQVARIVTFDGDLERAEAGQSVTLILADDIDVSRGDVIASTRDEPIVSDRLNAHIVWMGKAALAHGRSYLLKLGASVASARVETPLQVIDLNTRRWSEADRLAINDIGACTLQLDRLLAVDEYRHSKATGSFILIDPESYDTIAMGMIVRP